MFGNFSIDEVEVLYKEGDKPVEVYKYKYINIIYIHVYYMFVCLFIYSFAHSLKPGSQYDALPCVVSNALR